MKGNCCNLVVIVTNYNNSRLSIEFFESANRLIAAERSMISHFIVVDNNSDETEKEILRCYDSVSPIQLIRIYSEQNLGYFNGLNLGIDYIAKNGISFYSLIIGNNDMCFENNFLREFDNVLGITEDFPVICPNLVDLDNTNQNPHILKKISFFRRTVYSVFYRNFLVSRLIMMFVSFFDLKRKIPVNHYSGIIEGGYGACYIINQGFFKYYQRLFAPYFLMFEETALSFQLNNIGYKQYYCNNLVIRHFEHSTFQKYNNRFSWKCGSESYFLSLRISDDFKLFQISESNK